MKVVRRFVSGEQAGHERREIHVISAGERFLVRWIGPVRTQDVQADDEDAALEVAGQMMVGRAWTEVPADRSPEVRYGRSAAPRSSPST